MRDGSVPRKKSGKQGGGGRVREAALVRAIAWLSGSGFLKAQRKEWQAAMTLVDGIRKEKV